MSNESSSDSNCDAETVSQQNSIASSDAFSVDDVADGTRNFISSHIDDEDPIPDVTSSESGDSAGNQSDDSKGDSDTTDTHGTTPVDPPMSRYHRRERKQTRSWYITSTANCVAQVEVTTGDETILREAMLASP